MASWAGGVTVATAMLEQADQVLERRAIAETADKVQVILETSNRKANYSSADLLRNMGVPTLSGKKVRVVVHSPRHPQPDVGPRVRRRWPWGRGLGKGCQAEPGASTPPAPTWTAMTWSWRSSSLRPTLPQINYAKSQQCRTQERESCGFGHHLAGDRERGDVTATGCNV